MTWQPGKKLKTRPYLIEKEIAEGGFGITYKAKHLDLNFPVVIKTPNAKLRKDANYPKFVEGFRKEGRMLAKISQESHPNIVGVKDLFDEEDLPCLVMDFVPGENLYHLVQERGRLTEATAIKYIQQIANALSVCHQQGVIHRDAHPGNMILRQGTDRVVLIDFGLAGNVNTQTINQSANQAFAPWEQMIEGEKAPTIDIYTIAASLFYLLTMETPTPCLARKLMNKPLEPPIKYNSNISSGLNQAILKGLELEPANRPQSIEQWLKLFTSVPNQVPIREDRSLKSSCGMDYRKLRDLLSTGKWKEADQETHRVMLAVMKREKEGWLRVEDIDNFPCEDLRTIDQLWVGYSNGRFGFSVQKQIYQSLGGTRNYDQKVWEAFGDKVGWRKGGSWLYYKDITFNLNAPSAHLPYAGLTVSKSWRWFGSGWMGGLLVVVGFLLSRGDL